ncbi:ribosomal protein S2, flavodoxin-like domain-containing protein [Jimgerdemannia flammicorona]|uniref:Ribosomal protein S2, flavodoxin-like domain-containing protein n=1 Tax=Jimgerdemannia flammicorona TaxID=994334 RepID=A0A433DJT7_9FUNG|nr:ribosomal protein S2, flavodoxin-like domain-containing protein [Jimgerdemannia flammicorona]
MAMAARALIPTLRSVALITRQTTARCFASTIVARQENEDTPEFEETPEVPVPKTSRELQREVDAFLGKFGQPSFPLIALTVIHQLNLLVSPRLSSPSPAQNIDSIRENFPKPLPDPPRFIPNPAPPSQSPTSYTLTISHLIAAGLHLGHSTSLWNPATLPFIFGTRAGISIINLEHTLVHLRRACQVLREISLRGGIIIFVGTRPGIYRVVINAARRAEAYHIFTRWIPGTLTNAIQVLGRYAPPNPDDPSRPPRIFKPDVLIVLNPIENEIAIAEAMLNRVPVIAITDTDYDPRKVTYPIPANDDSVRGVELVAGVLAEAAREGVLKRKMLKDKMEMKELRKGEESQS